MGDARPRGHRVRWGLLLFGLRALCAGDALADAGGASGDAADPQARAKPADGRHEAARMFSAGEIAFKKADYASAAQSFEAAYKAFAAPEIAFSAAQAYRLGNSLLRRPRADYVKRSIELYEIYVGAVQQGGRVADAATHLQALRAIWRDLEADGAARAAQMTFDRTQLTVWAAVDGAEVTIDGEDAAAYAYVDVTPGEHQIAVTAPGYYPFEQRVSVAKGAQVPVSVELRAKPAVLRISTEGDAEIAIDGRPAAVVDGKVEAAAGKRWVTVTRSGRAPFSKEVTLQPGEEIEVQAPLTTTVRRRAVRWVLWGSAGALAITGATTAVALVADHRAVDQREVPNQASDRTYETWRQRRDTFRTAAFVSGAVTLAAVTTAAFLYFSDHPRPEAAPFRQDDERRPRAPEFTPMVWSDGYGAGLAVQGGF
jgi:PEGA domain